MDAERVGHTSHVATPLGSHGCSGEMNSLVRLAQQVKILEPAGGCHVGGSTADVRFVAPVLDVELDRVPGQLAEVAFKLILKRRVFRSTFDDPSQWVALIQMS